MFLKRANQHVIPMEFYIKFHYSFEYNYTFLLTAKRVTHMSPFADGVKYPIKELLFLLADNEAEGNITEFSESWHYFLKKRCSKGSYELELNGIQRRVNDLLVDMNFEQALKTGNFEGNVTLDITEFKDSKHEKMRDQKPS